jgi:hypothetical protein
MEADGKRTEVPLSQLEEGHRILAVDKEHNPTFAAVEKVLRSPAKEAYINILMSDASNHLMATLHHTFPTCANGRLRNRGTVLARDLKAGDCLHTAGGRDTVVSAEHVEPEAGAMTYSIKMTEGVDTISIGGILTHAQGASLAGHAMAQTSGLRADSTTEVSPIECSTSQ